MDTDRPSEPTLEDLRKRITTLDQAIIDAVTERRSVSEDIIGIKERAGSSLRDPRREDQLLNDLVQFGRQRGLDAHYVTSLFHLIIEDSVRLQQRILQKRANADGAESELLRVAFHGADGSYCHLAARNYFVDGSEHSALIGYSSLEEVFESAEQGLADYAVLPIENTTAGAVYEVYDLLLRSKLSIVGELKHRRSHSLFGTKAVPMATITRVFCTPHSAAECSGFLRKHPHIAVELVPDTGAALERIRTAGDPTAGVIASSEISSFLSFERLENDLSNHADNFNRYLVLARAPREVDQRIPSKTSLVFATAQKPGSLVEALLVFRDQGINLTKLESRPLAGNPWEEMFYLDFEGNLRDDRIVLAMRELTNRTKFLRVLGCYPSYDVARTFPSIRPGTMSTDDAPKVASEQPTRIDKAAPKKSSASASYKLASREYRTEDTIIDVQGVRFGGDEEFVVIAGPCSVESYEQVMACAEHASNNGARIFRGGVFKPRTSPYSFQGLGFDGLDLLVQAGRAYGLPIITEVLAAEELERVAEKADIIQIGARNMQNFSLLKEVGLVHRPVMLKRGMSSSIEELLQAVEYILAGGNHQVFLCERGIRTFETATRSTLDLSAVPVLRERTHLPVFVDPSHAAGTRDLVPALARAAKAVGAHGIIVEFHPNPEQALSDGPQALRFPQFSAMMSDLLKR